MKKILPIIMLILWIFIYPAFGGAIAWLTGYPSLNFIGLIGIIAIFNLVWFLAKLNYKNEHLDILTTVGNLIILNIPAYLLIKAYYKEKNKKYHNTPSHLNSLIYSSWELEELLAKNPKKYYKIMSESVQLAQKEVELTDQDLVYQGFGIFLLTLIYEQEPDLVNTFKIISQFKKHLEDEQVFLKDITEFKKLQLTSYYDQDFLKKLGTKPSQSIYDLLLKSDPEEVYLVFKTNRVEMQNKAKQLINNNQ